MKKKLFLFVLALCAMPVLAESFSMKAYEKLHRQCQRNNLDACVQFGIWTRDYMESPAEAVAPMQKACDGGNMKGCNVLGGLYLNEYSGLGMDDRQAKALYERACRGGYQNACTNLQNTDWEELAEQRKNDGEARRQRLHEACMLENVAACQALQREKQKN